MEHRKTDSTDGTANESADARLDGRVPSSDVVHEPSQELADEALVRRLYFGGLGLVYLIALLSLWSQLHGLIGQQGLLPVERYLRLAHEKLGTDAFRVLPTLLWFGSSDFMLHFWCALGVLLSLGLCLGWAPRITLGLLWAIYLSLCVAGQDFLSFQWDTLLLEMTVCSWFYAPRGLRPDWTAPVDSLARWPQWGLAFKLMFLSGVTKLLSGDRSWIDGSALEFHCYTQPIPNWLAWYQFQCPRVVHQASLVVLFVVEALLPFLIFFGQRGRAVFGISTIVLMFTIEATGNFGFFNLQTMVLCLPLLNGNVLRRLMASRWWNWKSVTPVAAELRAESSSPAPLTVKPVRRVIMRIAVFVLLSISLLTGVEEISSTARAGKMPKLVMRPIELADTALLSWAEPWFLRPIAPFRTINGYGLFRVMTTHRNEIILETSDDGVTWIACEFPYKPGSVDRAPPIVAPHMPRLDWQMWFAALNPRGSQHWLSSMMQRILDGSPSVAWLIGHPEFATRPPKFVRLVVYEYKFTPPDQANGAWWNRTFIGNLTQAISK